MKNLKFFSLSSPVRYAGTNLTLLLLAAIYFAFTVLPYRTEMDHIILSYAATILFTASVSCGVSLIFINPGFIQQASVAPEQIINVCRTCNAKKILRISHCASCDICIETRDHHCVFLGMCIGKQNYLCYFSLLTCMTFLTITVAIHTFLVLYHARLQEVLPVVTLSVNIILFVFFLMLTLGVGSLWVFHIYLCKTGMTTKEYFTDNPNSRMRSNIFAGGDETDQPGNTEFLPRIEDSLAQIQIVPNEQRSPQLSKDAEERLKNALMMLRLQVANQVEEIIGPEPVQVAGGHQNNPQAQNEIQGTSSNPLNPTQQISEQPNSNKNLLQAENVIPAQEEGEGNQSNSQQNLVNGTQSPLNEIVPSIYPQISQSQIDKISNTPVLVCEPRPIKVQSKENKQNQVK